MTYCGAFWSQQGPAESSHSRIVAHQEFKARLDEDQQDKFHSKLKKQGLTTFANISIEHKSKNSRDIIVLKADRNLFSHMILVAESRQVNMKDVFAHP